MLSNDNFYLKNTFQGYHGGRSMNNRQEW